jgi:hypothetical protein
MGKSENQLQVARVTCILGWGPRLRRGTDLIRSLDPAIGGTGGGSRPWRDRQT